MKSLQSLQQVNRAKHNHMYFLLSFPQIFYAFSKFFYSLNSNFVHIWVRISQRKKSSGNFLYFNCNSYDEVIRFDNVLVVEAMTVADLSRSFVTPFDLSCHFLSCFSWPVLSCPDLSWPFLSFPFVSFHFPLFPFIFRCFLSIPVVSLLVLTCTELSLIVLTCPAISCCFL